MSIKDRNLKPGTVLVATYRKETFRCTVVEGEDGKPVYRVHGGEDHTSPSAAGSAVMGGTACNGWRFWSVEGDEEPKAERKAASKAKAKPKARAKSKAKGRSKAKAKDEPKADEPKADKPVACGECKQEFPSSREAANHMRDAHGSVEAPGNGA